MDRIVIEGSNGESEEIETKVFQDASKLKPLLNSQCWKVFEKLREQPSYPAKIAKELGISEQKAYYYFKQLKNSGLIRQEKTEEIQGALAKYFSASYDSFALVPKGFSAGKHSKVLKKPSAQKASGAEELLEDFTKNSVFSAKIVVGSPDPHGKFKARARDGHLAAEFAAFVASNCSGYETPLIFIDTMVKDLKNENSNLVIIGGPVTNKLAEQVNEFLPVKFSPSGGNWVIKSEASGKEYVEDSVGIIEKIPHPYYKNKWLLLLAGKRNSGTISAILALAKNPSKASKPNTHNAKIHAHVVEGLDVNGDGLIDEVEFRE